MPPVYPHPHITTRDKERITMVAVLTAVLPVYPHPLAHRDLSGKVNVTVAQFRIFIKNFPCLFKQDSDTFLRNSFGRGGF